MSEDAIQDIFHKVAQSKKRLHSIRWHEKNEKADAIALRFPQRALHQAVVDISKSYTSECC